MKNTLPIFTILLFSTLHPISTEELSQKIFSTRNNPYSNQSSLELAKSLHYDQDVRRGGETLTAYQEALWDRLPQTSATTHAIQAAAPLFYEILTNQWQWCQQAHLNRKDYPALRGVYTLLWTGLSEYGWSLWNDECLEKLHIINKTKRILYPAGGTDIAVMLSHGIYNIDIIDPYPETQARYYATNYKWLIGISPTAKIGDHFTEQFGDFTLTLTRIQLASQRVPCAWQVRNTATNEFGIISFSQRYLEPYDLFTSKHILLSFNELIFLCLPQQFGGWALDIKNLPSWHSLSIKQLPELLNFTMLMNLRALLTLSYVDFKFIALGNDIE